MDNFMDKLAKRFNAGEIIKANAQAEAKEMKRLQEQAEEYDKMMQEMRRLNLKNIEVTEQVQQLIQSGIEQIEEYDQVKETLDRDNKEKQEELKQIGDQFEVLQRQCQLIQDQFPMLDQKIRDEFAQISVDLTPVENKLDKLNNDILPMGEAFNGVKENISSMEKQIDNQVNNIQKEFVPVHSEINGLDNRLKKIGESLEGLSQLKVALADMTANKEQIDSMQKQIEEVAGEIKQMQPIISGLQEYVHKENVKVYRNLQAVILDVAMQRTRELGDRIDQLEKASAKNRPLLPLLIITMLMAAGTLVIQLATMFQLF